MKSIEKWFKNQYIKKKIMIIYVPIVIFSFFILGIISNTIFIRNLVKITTKNFSDNSKLIIMRISDMLKGMENCANDLIININSINSEQHILSQDDQIRLQLRNKITNELGNACMIFSDVETTIFIDTNHNLYYPLLYKNYSVENNFAYADEMLGKINNTFGKNVWFDMHKRDYLTLDKAAAVLTLGKEVWDIRFGEKIGTIIVNINENAFTEVYKGLGPVKGSSYFICNSNGVVISSTVKEDVLKPVPNDKIKNWILNGDKKEIILKIDDRDILFTKVAFPQNGWQLVGKVPLAELSSEAVNISRWIIGIGFLCLVFALSGSILLSRLIANPINRLKEGMQEIQKDNLVFMFEEDSKDEIGLLALGINKMVERIKELVEDINETQRKKREYELALIQTQIKPHFLYNTLESACALSELGRNKDAQKILKALANFYRTVLSNGKEKISIREEIKSVIDYLSIQKIRYADVIDYEIDVDEEINNYLILKLTIQPLIENAIYHGLKHKEMPGKIQLTGRKEAANIVITVIDDGIGIPANRLKELFSDRKDNKNSSSFGISSINERIKLFYGEEYGLRISSEPGKGFEVVITIPAVLEGGTSCD